MHMPMGFVYFVQIESLSFCKISIEGILSCKKLCENELKDYVELYEY